MKEKKSQNKTIRKKNEERRSKTIKTTILRNASVEQISFMHDIFTPSNERLLNYFHTLTEVFLYMKEKFVYATDELRIIFSKRNFRPKTKNGTTKKQKSKWDFF